MPARSVVCGAALRGCDLGRACGPANAWPNSGGRRGWNAICTGHLLLAPRQQVLQVL